MSLVVGALFSADASAACAGGLAACCNWVDVTVVAPVARAMLLRVASRACARSVDVMSAATTPTANSIFRMRASSDRSRNC